MMNLPANSMPPSKPANSYFSHRPHRRLVYALLAIAPIGFLDASYLTIEHFLKRIPPCSITHGCEKVTTSVYSVILGVPMSLLGALYYLAVIIGLIYFLDAKKDWALKLVSGFTAVGFLFSLYLVYLQFFVIKAICQWCMLSALSSIALFIFGFLVLKSHQSWSRAEVVAEMAD